MIARRVISEGEVAYLIVIVMSTAFAVLIC